MSLNPKDSEVLLEMQNRGLNKGRLAMVAIAKWLLGSWMCGRTCSRLNCLGSQLENATGTELHVQGQDGLTSSIAMFPTSGKKAQPTSQDSTEFVMHMPDIVRLL